jgi:hypothetical protein
MTALVDSGYISRKKFPFNDFRATDLHFTSQAFGPEPNALPNTLWLLEPKKFWVPRKFESFPRSADSVAADSREASSGRDPK